MGRDSKQAAETAISGARCIALVGPYLSGKTSLMEAILARTGAIDRQGSVTAGSSVGDSAPEARAHGMSVELNLASCTFMDDRYCFIDCPGSVEFQGEQLAALPIIDAAIVVCEPDDKKVAALQVILHRLEELNIPHFLFINKIDKAQMRLQDMLEMLQPASGLPLLLRQIPIWENGIATGFIDLALERAHIYREHAPSEVVDVPDALRQREEEARFSMLEKLADYDDALMEQLLEDIEPAQDIVFEDLAADLSEGLVVPVLLGAAEHGNGILRVLKALRHEAPDVRACRERLGVESDRTVVQIVKTLFTPHGGKLSVARILSGSVGDGAVLVGPDEKSQRVGGIFELCGADATKRERAVEGDVVALGRLDEFSTGLTVYEGGASGAQLVTLAQPRPVFGLTIVARERKDEVKLTAALGKILDEDSSLSLEHNQDAGEMRLWGQGEMHLRVALERLTGKYGIDADTGIPSVAYRETIRKPTTARGRHKKQSGGHGQFGDVVVEISPLARGEGLRFSDRISGGVVPKQYIPAVENGVRDYLTRGPLGFTVVDVAVCLIDGSYHSVDSSEQAFRLAGRLAMANGLAECAPVLLEPVMNVSIFVPTEATAKVTGIVSTRRGQILGFDTRAGWSGWDQINAYLPAAEMQDLIIELRSASAGVGFFEAEFNHLNELTGKLADQVRASREAA